MPIRRHLSKFEALSTALFTALAAASLQPVHAQQAPAGTSSPSVTATTAPMAPVAAPPRTPQPQSQQPQ